MANERILIVDSMAQHSTWVAENILKPRGYQPMIAIDGLEGVNLTLQQPPDLILLDDKIAKSNGLQIFQTLQSQDIKVPIILMSIQHTETISLKALRLGVKDYLLKPLLAHELLIALERLLPEKRLFNNCNQLKQELQASSQEANRYRQQLHTLSSLRKLTATAPKLPKFWERLVEAAAYLTRADESMGLWLNPHNQTLRPMATWGVDKRYLAETPFELADSLAQEVIMNGQPLMQPHPTVNQTDIPYPLQAVLYVPIICQQQVRGVLRVSNRHRSHPFEPHDIRLLELLADYAAQWEGHETTLSQVEQAEQQLTMTLQHLTEAIIITRGATHQIRFANPMFRAMFNLQAEPVEQRPLLELLPQANWLELFNTATPDQHREITLADERTLKVMLTPLSPQEHLITMQDLTEIKQITTRQNEFVTLLSHQLDTPLSILKNATQILKRYDKLERGQQQLLVHQMTESMEQVMTVVDDMLEIQAVETEFESENSWVDLDKVILQVVSSYQEQAEQQEQQLVYHQPKQSLVVWGQASRLAQVMQLLVENALSHAPAKGRVAVLVQLLPEQVIVKVEDSGPQLSMLDQWVMFDKFFKRNPTHPQSKTGLGLALCKSVIEKHHGHIWVQSHPDQGTVFTFTLPLAKKRHVLGLRLAEAA